MKRFIAKTLATTVSMAAAALLLSTAAQAFVVNVATWDGTTWRSGATSLADPIVGGGLVSTTSVPAGSVPPTLSVTNPSYGASIDNIGSGVNYVVNSSLIVHNGGTSPVTSYVFVGSNNFQGPANISGLIANGSWNTSNASSSIQFSYYNAPDNSVLLEPAAGFVDQTAVNNYLTSIAAYQIGQSHLYTSWNTNGLQENFGANPTDPQGPYNPEVAVADVNSTFAQMVMFKLVLAPGDSVSNRFQSVSTTTAVPEPSTYLLLGLGLGIVGVVRRKLTKTA